MHIFNHRFIASRQSQDPFIRRIGNDPYVDWLIMLVCFVALVAGFVFVGYETYVEAKARLSAPVNATPSIQRNTFDPQELSKVLTEFNDRNARKGNIIQGVGISGDPSM